MPKIRILAGFLYITALHVALVGAVLKPDSFAKVRYHLGMDNDRAVYLAATDTRQYKQNLLAVPGSVVFLGDSITEALPHGLVADHAINFGIPGETTSEMIDRIKNYRRALHGARLIFLEIGINDFIQGKSAAMAQRYQALLSSLPGNTPVVASAIMPVHISKEMRFTLHDIRGINKEFQAACNARKNCVFVDTWQALATSDQIANASYFDNDGIHLNAVGYARWIPQLQTASTGVVAGVR